MTEAWAITTSPGAMPSERRSAARCCLECISTHRILTLDEAAGVLARRDVPEGDVALQSAEERDPGTDEHGNACDDEALNEPGLEETAEW